MGLVERSTNHEYPPLWVVVPDAPADAVKTIDQWHKWSLRMPPNCPLACAVQDGMTAAHVRKLRPEPDVIFVGGTTTFKWKTLTQWTKEFPKVHVGRVNTGRLLWMCHRARAESSDGTGWWHTKQKKQLVEYLRRSTLGKPERDDLLTETW